MSDLIFVPELGLISGKSQNLKIRMWYPQPQHTRLRLKTSAKLKKKQLNSPFNQTQRLFQWRLQSQSPKRNDSKKNATALEAKLQKRPGTMSGSAHNTRKNSNTYSKAEEGFFTTALDIGLQARPATMSGSRRNRMDNNVIEEERYEGYGNLPALQPRPAKNKSEFI